MNVLKNRQQLVLETALAAAMVVLIPRMFSFFSIRYYPLLNRIVYYSNYQEPVFGNFLVDDLVLITIAFTLLFLNLGLRRFAISSVPPLVVAATWGLLSGNALPFGILAISSTVAAISITIIQARRPMAAKIRKEKVTAIFFTILVVLEAAALARWVAFPVWPDRIYGSPSWFPAKFEASVFHGFGSFAIYLSLLLPFAFLLIPFRKYVVDALRATWAGTEQSTSELSRYIETIERRHLPVLVGLMALSSAFAALQYVPAINPTNQLFGVDFYDYAQRMEMHAQEEDAVEFLAKTYASNSERPLTIIVLVGVERMLGTDALGAVKLIPLILGPALVFSVYKFVRHAFGNISLSLLAAFLTATSSYLVIGLYGGFVANWMAITAMFGFLTFMLHFWKKKDAASYISALSLLVVILFLHVYTWTFLVLAMSLFLAWSYVYVRKDREKTKLLGLIALVLAASVGVDLFKANFGGTLAGFEVDQNLAQESVSGNMFTSRWNNLTFAINTYLGGGLGSIMPLVLALIWLVDMKFSNDSNRIVASFFFLAAPLMLFGDYVIQSRLLYILPLNIAMSMGVYAIASNLRDKRTSLMFVAFVVLYQLNYALRSISNFYFLPPQ